MLRILLLIVLMTTLSACTKNPDGSFTAGMVGSTMWHQTAPASTVNAYYDSKQTYELCLSWDRYYKLETHHRFKRRQIAKHLQRRGENPLKCANPSSDESRKLRDETKQIRREAQQMRRESEENRREAEYQREQAERMCREAHDAYDQCTRNNPSGFGNCNYPNCRY